MTSTLTDEEKKARRSGYNARYREKKRQERLNDPEYGEEYLRKRAASNFERREAIKADPEMREKYKAREKIYNSPRREKTLQRRLNDPEFAEQYRRRRRVEAIALYAKVKADPEAYAEKLRQSAEYKRNRRRTDPAFRASEREKRVRDAGRVYEASRSDVMRGINPALRDSTYAALFSLVSPGHPERDDLISEAMVKLLEGEASTPAEALKLGSREHYRKFADRRRTRSLDEKSKFTGMSLYDVIGA